MPARPCLFVACAPSGSRIHPPYVKLFRKHCPAESTRIVERPKNQGPEQLRVITLSRTMNGDEGIEVVFHPEQQEFRLANAATRKDSNWIRVSELWDDDLYRQLRRNLDGSRNAARREARFEAIRKILDYEIPV